MRRSAVLAAAVVTCLMLNACSHKTGNPSHPVPPAPTEPVPVREPVQATVPQGQPAALLPTERGYRLVMAQGAYIEWEQELPNNRWAVFFQDGSGSWAVDLQKGVISRWPLDPLSDALRSSSIPDGRMVGVRGNGPGGLAVPVKLVIQDLTSDVEREIGVVNEGVEHLVWAGDSRVMYSLPNTKPLAAGPLWQYDWSTSQYQLIADQGWPVGLLSDGSAVAHTDRMSGKLITWRPEAPGSVRVLSEGVAVPFGAVVSPDRRYLYYFQSLPGAGVHTDDPPGQNRNASAVAVFDSTSRTTTQARLPVTGAVLTTNWDPQGNILLAEVRVQGDSLTEKVCYVNITRAADASLAYCSTDKARFAGWAKEEPVIRIANGDFIVVSGAGEPRRVSGQVVEGEGLLGTVTPEGLKVLDLKSGEYFLTTKQFTPSPSAPRVYLGGIRPHSGYIAVIAQATPNQEYELLPVQRIH